MSVPRRAGRRKAAAGIVAAMGYLRKLPYARCLCIQVDIARLLDQYSRGYNRQTDGKLTPSSDQLPWRGTLVGCSRMSESWKEEVRLSDGRLIVVKRTAKGRITRDMAMRATGWIPRETTVRMGQVDGAAKPPVWRSDLIPVVMDYDPAASTWSVVATYLW